MLEIKALDHLKKPRPITELQSFTIQSVFLLNTDINQHLRAFVTKVPTNNVYMDPIVTHNVTPATRFAEGYVACIPGRVLAANVFERHNNAVGRGLKQQKDQFGTSLSFASATPPTLLFGAIYLRPE